MSRTSGPSNPTWSEYFTPSNYQQCLNRTHVYVAESLPGLSPEDAEDLTHAAMLRCLARKNTVALPAKQLNWFFYRNVSTCLRNLSHEPLLQARGLRTPVGRHKKNEFTEQQPLTGQLRGPHPRTLIQSLAEDEALQFLDDLLEQHHPKANGRNQRILRYVLLGYSRKEMADFEGVSVNRIASLLSVLTNTLSNLYYRGEMTPILEVYNIPPPTEEDRIAP